MRLPGGRQPRLRISALLHIALLACLLTIGLSGISCSNDSEPELFKRLIFLPRQNGDYDIRLRTTNDRMPVELGRVLPWDSQPSWSPDGSRIVFYSDRNFNLPDRDNNVDIYVMPSASGSLTRLTEHPASDAFPHWSPDGSRIAFYSERDGNGEVYIMNADGSGVTRITNEDALDIPYDWSPDGRRLVIASGRSGNLDLYAVEIDDGGAQRLTKGKGHDLAARWSPDGRRIAFESTRDGNVEVFIMDVDGSNQINLTVRPLRDTYPVWSPDGVRLAFVSDRTADNEIYVLDTNYSLLNAVTVSPREDAWPAWSPDGSQIAYGAPAGSVRRTGKPVQPRTVRCLLGTTSTCHSLESPFNGLRGRSGGVRVGLADRRACLAPAKHALEQ